MRISLLSACLGTWIGLTFACSFLKSLQTACKKEHGQDLVVKGTSHCGQNAKGAWRVVAHGSQFPEELGRSQG